VGLDGNLLDGRLRVALLLEQAPRRSDDRLARLDDAAFPAVRELGIGGLHGFTLPSKEVAVTHVMWQSCQPAPAHPRPARAAASVPFPPDLPCTRPGAARCRTPTSTGSIPTSTGDAGGPWR